MVLNDRGELLTNHSHQVNLKETAFHDVDDVQVETKSQVQSSQVQHANNDKLKHAIQVAEETAVNLRGLTEGLDNRMQELGEISKTAKQFEGQEKVYNFLGTFSKAAKQKAVDLRHDRISHLSFDAAIKEIGGWVDRNIETLGDREVELKTAKVDIIKTLDSMIAKQQEVTPLYLKAQADRQALEGDVQALDEEIKSGTLEESQLPEKNHKLEEKRRQLDAITEQENKYLVVLTKAKAAIPDNQKVRDSLTVTIQSIHSMRLSLSEKFANYKEIWKHSPEAIKTENTVQMYESVDATFNATTEAAVKNFVAMAGGVVSTWAERSSHDAINPDVTLKLANELKGHLQDALASLEAQETKLKANKGYTNGAVQ